MNRTTSHTDLEAYYMNYTHEELKHTYNIVLHNKQKKTAQHATDNSFLFLAL